MHTTTTTRTLEVVLLESMHTSYVLVVFFEYDCMHTIVLASSSMYPNKKPARLAPAPLLPRLINDYVQGHVHSNIDLESRSTCLRIWLSGRS